MSARVLLALAEGGDELAAALRGVGCEVERCGSSRLARAVAEGAHELVVLEAGRAAPAWARSADAPAWIALSSDPAARRAALEAGAEAALDARDAPVLVGVHALRALERRRAALEAARATERRDAHDAWVLDGPSAAARRLGDALARVASTPRTTVLVRGPLGAPLDELARLVHARSARGAGPCIALEAAGTAPERWAEVLGRADAPGTADGGSLVVREVARLDAAGQAALAEGLQPRAESADGGLRLIATTSRDLAAEVEAGRLREDLAYRLNVLTLIVPALGERREDVPQLALHLAARAARRLGRAPRRLEAAEHAALARRDWPGDLFELSLYMAARELPGGAAAPAAPPVRAGAAGLGTPESLVVADRSLRAVEEALIRRVLEETGGNKLRAAEILGIHRTTLYAKLAAYGLGSGAEL